MFMNEVVMWDMQSPMMQNDNDFIPSNIYSK